MNKDYKLYVHIAPNGKRYYGITKQEPERRWANGKGYSNNQYFTKAINKYGWDNIQHIVLHEGLDKEEAGELEKYMIQWYDTANRHYGYNISLGGENSSPTEETRKKLSEAGKGRVVSEETREKLSEANKGKKLSEEIRKKISEANKGLQAGENHPLYGKHHSEESKKKISEAQMGKNNPMAKSVICITTNRVFGAAAEGARYYNILAQNISKCCTGKYKYTGKLPTGTPLVWRYIDIIEL